MKMMESFGPLFAKDKCRNRYKTYKKWYGHLKQIMNLYLFGFGWDPSKNTLSRQQASKSHQSFLAGEIGLFPDIACEEKETKHQKQQNQNGKTHPSRKKK